MSGKSLLPPDAWHWSCHWPGCGLSTRGAGPFCHGHYVKLSPKQRAEATAAMDAYKADLVAAVTHAAAMTQAQHTDRFLALARRVAPSPVALAREKLKAPPAAEAP